MIEFDCDGALLAGFPVFHDKLDVELQAERDAMGDEINVEEIE